jgi:hypothetical protein
MDIEKIIEDCLKDGNTKGNGQAWEVLDWDNAKTKIRSAIIKSAQHNAHPTPESLSSSQAVVNASVLEQLDGDTSPAQAQVA